MAHVADKEINVKFVTEVDLSNLEELTEAVNELKEDKDVEIGVDVDDSSVEEATEKTKELNEDLDETDSKTVSPDVDSSGIDELKDKTEEASSSMDSLVTAAAGIGVTAGVEQMVTTADRINTSWNQLELTFGSVTEKMKSSISDAANVTGRSGGEIRGYFNQMGIAGVTNTDLLSSSFEALSGKAYQTGNSIEAMEGKMQTMVLTGNASSKMLKSLGLSAEDLAQAMGVSADQVSDAFKNMTPEERLQAITKAMGDGAEANEMYKNSYAGLKAQAEAAMAGLMGAVGEAILPVVIPALQAATNFIKFLADGFKSLPGPVQGVIGGLLGFAGIVITAIGVLGTLGTVFTTVKTGLEALNIVSGLAKVATYAQAAAQWALNIAMSANPIGILIIAIGALIAILAYLYMTNEDVRNAINGVADAFMNVLTPIINTVSALFNNFTAQLGLNTNDWTQAVLGFILFIPQLPMALGLALADSITRALGFGDSFVQAMYDAAWNAYDSFKEGIDGLSEALQEELDEMISSAQQFSNDLPWYMKIGGAGAVLGWIGSTGEHSPGFMYDAFHGELVAMAALPLTIGMMIVTNITALGGRIVNGFISIASRAVSGFSSAIQGIANAIQRCLDWAYSIMMSHPIVQAAVALGNAIANGFSALGLGQRSPGKMVKAIKQELNWSEEEMQKSSLPSVSAVLGANVASSFNPELNIGSGPGNVGGGSSGGGGFVVNVYGDVDSDKRVKQIVDAVKDALYWDNVTAGRTV